MIGVERVDGPQGKMMEDLQDKTKSLETSPIILSWRERSDVLSLYGTAV